MILALALITALGLSARIAAPHLSDRVARATPATREVPGPLRPAWFSLSVADVRR